MHEALQHLGQSQNSSIFARLNALTPPFFVELNEVVTRWKLSHGASVFYKVGGPDGVSLAVATVHTMGLLNPIQLSCSRISGKSRIQMGLPHPRWKERGKGKLESWNREGYKYLDDLLANLTVGKQLHRQDYIHRVTSLLKILGWQASGLEARSHFLPARHPAANLVDADRLWRRLWQLYRMS